MLIRLVSIRQLFSPKLVTQRSSACWPPSVSASSTLSLHSPPSGPSTYSAVVIYCCSRSPTWRGAWWLLDACFCCRMM